MSLHLATHGIKMLPFGGEKGKKLYFSFLPFPRIFSHFS